MIIHSIHIKEGMLERTFKFSNSANLIYSSKNSRGKTTLLRFLLYSLGYNIPNTRKIKFERCEVDVCLETETCGKITMSRFDLNSVIVNREGKKTTFVMPSQLFDLHKMLFGTSNKDLLNNILGAYYVDQEKGWTLLNRGVVIGSIRFNIEDLLRGLSGYNCDDLIAQRITLERELAKYRQIFSVAQYRESVIKESGSLIEDDYEGALDIATEQQILEEKRLKAELTRIDGILSDNKQFKKYVSEMKLVVQSKNGELIPVTPDNIVGLTDTIDFLIAKRKIVAADLSELSRKITNIKKEKVKETEQLSFWKSETLAEIFDKKIAAVPINAVAIEKEIHRLEAEIKLLRQQIDALSHQNSSHTKPLYDNIVKYATELGVGNSETLSSAYLFTSNLKELSGAVLHKTVFAFRLAYIIEIQTVLGIKLPIILDSPSGKEVDPENVRLMIEILKRDFSENQIIIASIFKYQFDNLNVIELQNKLIE